MRILYVANAFLEKNKPTTGLPIYLYKVSKALIRMGNEPIIVAGGVCSGVSNLEGIEVHTVSTFHDPYEKNIFINGKDILVTSYKLNQVVKKIHKEHPVDIIQYASPYGLGIFYRVDVPAVLRLSWYAKMYFYPYVRFEKAQVKLFTYMEKLQARRMTGIFGPGRAIAEGYGKDVKRHVTIIETPYENDVQELDDSVYRNQLVDKKYILYFGALLAEKGIFVIADIIYSILDRHKGYYFVFAGENVLCKGRYAMSYITKAAKQYRNRVIYLGRLDRSKLFPVIKGATVIVLPSIMENFANSCVEAMALGQIVVGTDGATYEQLITDGKSGFLAKPGDSQTLKTAIEKALALSQEDRYIMGKSAIRRIEQLCPEKTVRKLFAYYEYIIKKYQEKK